MKKITHYMVASATSVDTINETVTNLLKLGWQPFGNLAVEQVKPPSAAAAQKPMQPIFMQPLVKYAE